MPEKKPVSQEEGLLRMVQRKNEFKKSPKRAKPNEPPSQLIRSMFGTLRK
jgi:hypothetical protein